MTGRGNTVNTSAFDQGHKDARASGSRPGRWQSRGPAQRLGLLTGAAGLLIMATACGAASPRDASAAASPSHQGTAVAVANRPTPTAPQGQDTPPTSASTPQPRSSSSLPAGSQSGCTPLGGGTGEKAGGSGLTTAPLYLVEAGQHPCYDRVVFDINGPAPVSFDAKYVPQVLSDPAGEQVPVAGRAVLQIVVRAPIWGTDAQGHQPWRMPPVAGDDLVTPAQVAGWSALREVKFAGSSQGQSTFAVGVRAQLPFRVFVTSDSGYQHVVLDIGY